MDSNSSRSIDVLPLCANACRGELEKKTLSDSELGSTSYSSASQTQEEVVTVKRTTTKKSVRITQRKEQSSSRGGSRRGGHVTEGRSEDEKAETEVQSNSEGQECI